MKIFKRILLFLVIGTLAVVAYVALQIPSEKEIKGCLITRMFQVNLCPGGKDYVPLNKISQNLQRAVILTEDSNFWTHDGFDWVAIQDSAEKNFKKGKYLRGGSTISQQLAKNMFLYQEKSITRKLLEALITVKIEKTLTKKEILERYFNVVQFGKNIFTIKRATQFYFQKQPSQVDVVEAAFIVMLLPSPEKYSKSFYKKSLTPFAQRRISRIVGDMYRTGRISEGEFEQAKNKIQNMFGTQFNEDDSGIEEEIKQEDAIIGSKLKEEVESTTGELEPGSTEAVPAQNDDPSNDPTEPVLDN